jgi:tetratricopeptide (TPR) repeat protein
MPGSVQAHNNLGIALASQGKLQDAIDEFQRALGLRPDFEDAKRNLTTAVQARRQLSGKSQNDVQRRDRRGR